MNEILDKPLHKLAVGEIRVVRQLADTLFARLVRPFWQNRVEKEFSFKATLRDARRTGHLTPCYVRETKTHPRSNLVIAMSLSGIDRCFAVGLIPLLAQLRRHLSFRLFIYTDDLIEAEFSGDGFLANDCDIAWNNVLGPCVLSRLNDMRFDTQETKILLIDSLGGHDSGWFTAVSQQTLREVQMAQEKFIGDDNPWTTARNYLAGRYDEFDYVPKNVLPLNWEAKVVRNCEERWVGTPALKEYLIRYIFNPKFGQRKHGQYKGIKSQYDYVDVRKFLSPIKEKFKSVHLLTPAFTDDSQVMLTLLKKHRFVDFHHKADTLEGFAQVLVNIVYGRETDRITTPVIRFSAYKEELQGEDDEELASGHSELSRTLKDCFANCDPPAETLPPTTHLFQRRNRRKNELEDVVVPYCDVALTQFFSSDLWGIPKWEIDPMWTDYGKVSLAQNILSFVRENFITDESWGLDVRPRKSNPWDKIKNRVEYEDHHTRALRTHVDDALDLFAETYQEWFERLPLRHVVWCSVGKFRYDVMAISAAPADDPNSQRGTVFHELMHWAEHVCPPIGVFANNLMQHMTGDFQQHRLISVGVGEYAVPVRPGKVPWITDYAGKWYRRHHHLLPNPSEILTVHVSYFRSPEALVELLEHDPLMVRATAFVLMGGPLALLEQSVISKRREAEEAIEQKGRQSYSYTPKSRDQGKRKKEETNNTEPQIFEEDKTFGI